MRSRLTTLLTVGFLCLGTGGALAVVGGVLSRPPARGLNRPRAGLLRREEPGDANDPGGLPGSSRGTSEIYPDLTVSWVLRP